MLSPVRLSSRSRLSLVSSPLPRICDRVTIATQISTNKRVLFLDKHQKPLDPGDQSLYRAFASLHHHALRGVTRRRAIDKHCKTVFGCYPPLLLPRNACCPVHASNHATARTSSPPDPTLGRLAAVTRVSPPRGLAAPACSFRMVGLIVDVSPCAPVTKEAEGCSTPTQPAKARKREESKSRMREEEREKQQERKGGDAHFAFPTCCSVQTSCIACSPIRQSEGNGISQGLLGTGVGGELVRVGKRLGG